MHPLYTYGYHGSTPGDLRGYVATLEAGVVDLRPRPTSRDPAWRQAALVALLGPGRYHHCPVPARGDDPPADLDAVIATCAGWLAQQPLILLCACRHLARCRRAPLAAALAAQGGTTVEHLPPSLTTWAEAAPPAIARPSALGATLQALRAAQGWSRAVLAARAGLRTYDVGLLEEVPDADVTLTALTRLAGCFGLSAATLLTRADTPAAPGARPEGAGL